VVYVSGEGPPEVAVTTPTGPRPLSRLNADLEAVAHPRMGVTIWRTDAGDVEGIVYRPAEDAPGPRPLVVIPHGGPRDHTIAAYDPAAAYLAAQGYLVLRPNFRGSTGYGDSFARLNTGNWGDGPYRDVMAGVDALVGAGAADPARLFAYGWSYGGYLVNWIVTHTTRFRAAAGGAGVADLRMQYVLSDARRWRFDYFEGSPFRGHWPLYERESPITYAAAAKTPTLLFHGAEDVRVPLAQGTMMYRALRDNGVTTELVVYPREGHAFSEPRHVMDRLRRIEEWFSRHGGRR
jgi:dipeptidyl aminopeptidase/acylaminoacyl peptidase